MATQEEKKLRKENLIKILLEGENAEGGSQEYLMKVLGTENKTISKRTVEKVIRDLRD